MGIQSEITRISGNVSDAFVAITNKGVTVPVGSTSDDLADLISQISGGGGGTGAISIVDTPDSAGGTVRTITAVDISGDTVTAAHLETGYTAHDAEGNAITGTLSPGGGGVEYEEGTWTPAEDVADATILFANSHSVPPIFVMIADNSSQSIGVADSNAILVMGNLYTYLGHPVLNSNTNRYGLSVYSYTNASGMTTSSSNMVTQSSLEGYFTPSSFRAYTTSTSHYWRNGRTYKWIAVWAPTT